MIYAYTKVSTPYTTIQMALPYEMDAENQCTELCTLEGVTYVSVPDSVTLPDQEMRISSKYSLSDEQYFARIGVGAALGAYTFAPGEQDELLAFGAYVEAARQWGRDERAKLGL